MTQSYLRNRYYSPSIGRFITEDPIKDGLNWYVYCENNPINAIDPTGLDVYYFVNSVIASDGTVKNRSIFGNYKSVGDKHFVGYLWSGKKYRDNFDYIQYTKNSVGELEWNILGNKFSIKSVLNKANIKLGEI